MLKKIMGIFVIFFLVGCYEPSDIIETTQMVAFENNQDAVMNQTHIVSENKVEDSALEVTDEVEDSTSEEHDDVLESKPIKGLKPINRIVVGKDFIVSGIQSIEGIDANDPGIRAQWAIGYTNSGLIWDQVKQNQVVKIAVIDTGIDYTHPDLKNRINIASGYDFVNEDSDPMDDNGHGTHVAGIIAAEMNNSIGIVGIMGDLDVEIIPIKALNHEGSGDLKTLHDSIQYAIGLNVDIINLSLGAVSDDEELKEILQNAVDEGIFVVAAAGNDRSNCDNYLPAGMKGIYTVAASSPLNKAAVFSNYGKSIDLSGPGVKIISSVIGGGYEAWDGTSMAAPVVSGIAGLLLTHKPELSSFELAQLLNESAKDIGIRGFDNRTGYGLVDALKCFNGL